MRDTGDEEILETNVHREEIIDLGDQNTPDKIRKRDINIDPEIEGTTDTKIEKIDGKGSKGIREIVEEGTTEILIIKREEIPAIINLIN